ncbi:uncharacterized protein EV420DRAFT_591631 [Desarmillaria tabescens]|uniref:HMG box domain-containing protein n=1 Tax=Armillaria tabescens TaxID=1929756 RepID=A0AA39K650_ARMTA|nr:uncharacterized protein EV420DRAFT_591631 [Desarmillaria tabescens]KAK0455271.1 hypothetical protein EV420DRAFT_591631 [Desarmillaria tabescens]
MAPIRTMTTRRSRRLSSQVPVRYDEEGWEATDLLMYLTTPVSEAPSPSPSASYSSTQSDTPSPRRHTPSHRRTPDYVPRPSNSFILFRSDFWRDNKDTILERDHSKISTICGERWRALPPAEKEVYTVKARRAKEEHLAKYPDYKFAPVSRRKKTRKVVGKDRDMIEARCEKIAMMIGEGVEGMELERTQEIEDTCKTPTPLTPATERSPTPVPVVDFPAPDESVCDEEEDGFVPTCDIPPLDLNAPGLELYNHIPEPPSYAHIDPQFGFKDNVDADNCFWFKPTGEFVNPPAVLPTFTSDLFQPFGLDGTYAPEYGLGLSDTDLAFNSFNDAWTHA